MGALTRAVRNVSRRKIRAFLVIIALSFSMAIMIFIPAGIMVTHDSHVASQAGRMLSLHDGRLKAKEKKGTHLMKRLKCPYCGKKVQPDDTFCPGCGKKL